MPRWSELTYDILVLIANKLHNITDFLSFSVLCRNWNLVYRNKEWNCSQTTPWLMLSEHNTVKRRFFSFSNFKCYDLPVREAHGCRCWGTSLGWIAAFGEDFVLRLYNPVTRVCISLPSVKNMLGVIYTSNWFSTVEKAVVFNFQDKMVAMIICESNRTLAFSRCGDGYWATVKFPTTVSLSDVVCFNNQILAVTMTGTLIVVDMNDKLDGPKAYFAVSPPEGEKGWCNLYLAEPRNKLLLVFVYKRYCSPDMVKVYDLDVSKGKWTAVDDLGENVLLVDDYKCTSVPANAHFKPNCVYLVQDNSLSFSHFLNHKTWVIMYNIKDKTSEAVWLGQYSLIYSCPLWIIPSMR